MTTPLMEQYNKIKAQYQQEILLFRLGDFYEMFYEDAKIASKVLGIQLTSRTKGDGYVPMAGIPHHAAHTYINRLLKAGYRIAICEQIEEPEEAEGPVVDRAVVRVITPGTILEEGLLEERESNYLAAIYIKNVSAGLAWIELSAGKFMAIDIKTSELMDYLSRIFPSECLLPSTFVDTNQDFIAKLKESIDTTITPYHDWVFDEDNATRILLEHFGTQNLSGFGCEDLTLSRASAGAILHYLKQTHKGPVKHISKLHRYIKEDKMFLDSTTQRSLELIQTIRTGEKTGTLLWVLDKTLTPMGARLLKEWITQPLRDVQQINRRLDAVEALYNRKDTLKKIRAILQEISDIERICARIGSQIARAYDLVNLKDALSRVPQLKQTLLEIEVPLLQEIYSFLNEHEELVKMLDSAIVDKPPRLLTEGGLIKDGFDPELDKIRTITRDGKKWILDYQQREIQRTGIPSLKIGYNQVFGYYIEVTHTHKDRIPKDYIRKQTLKNAERFITPELKDFEVQMLNAQERQKKLEYEIFLKVRGAVEANLETLMKTASSVAYLDVICCLAQVALEKKYVKPQVDTSDAILIKAGRHPVLEESLKEKFVPNDIFCDTRQDMISIITGPNMAGKSTFIRQIALIVLLAQMGSFVPAQSAQIGVVDRIFTRIGASDEIMRGQSTFMVEMLESANILNNATSKSLIILDEIGRGTSTYDGLSIAWAIAEYIATKICARTLFATHYYELTALAKKISRIKNYRMDIREYGENVVFLYRVVEGASDKSYGIHVAKLAGVPADVTNRARQILYMLEQGGQEFEEMLKKTAKKATDESQLSLFDYISSTSRAYRELVNQIADLNVNEITPVQALNLLWELCQKAREIRGS